MLTPKQRRFVAEYLMDLNGTQAAIRAGYSKRTAAFIAAENLKKPYIAREIQKAMDERAERTGVSAERVLQEIARIAFFDLRKAFNPDGSLRPISDMDDETAAVVASLDVTELLDGDGMPTGRLKKIRFADKLGALTLLARHLGMLNDKVTLKGDADNPLTLLVKAIQGTSIKPVPTSAFEAAPPTH